MQDSLGCTILNNAQIDENRFALLVIFNQVESTVYSPRYLLS